MRKRADVCAAAMERLAGDRRSPCTDRITVVGNIGYQIAGGGIREEHVEEQRPSFNKAMPGEKAWQRLLEAKTDTVNQSSLQTHPVGGASNIRMQGYR